VPIDRGANRAIDSGERGSFVKRREDHMPVSKPWDGVGTKPGYDRGFFYTKRDTPMREYHLVGVAKGLSDAVEKGLVTDEGFAKSQIELASQMFPNESSPYRALAKLLDTNVGKVMTAKAAQANYERIQKGSALGDGYQAVMKANNERDEIGESADGVPHIRRANPSTPAAADTDDDSDDPDAALEKMGEEWRRTHPNDPLTKEQAIVHVATHTPEGRRLLAASKEKSLRKNVG
jgi:hypothetical protein